ncbi:MAG TPA: sulfite oxidase [Solirubrobacteraceae bacterium]|jgi:sulfite oxidase|nr:sulfite oxidase [Solirubrobacteraceae bacterium]
MTDDAAEASRALGKRGDMVVHTVDPYNAEPPRAALAAAPLTPLDAFYVRNHGPVPATRTASYRLCIDGLVVRPQELSVAELRDRFEERRMVATLQCAGNRRSGLQEVSPIPGEASWGPGATGTAEWSGVALADVLRDTGLAAEARYVELIGADISAEARPSQPFGASVSRRKALDGEVMLAWAMNGEPLPAVHGAPLRVVVPGYIGARSVKWLARISARETPSENFFQAQTYRLLGADDDADAGLRGAGFPLGAVAVNADFLAPADGSRVAAGELKVDGYAFAGDDRHIVRVDVSTDGGRHWHQAELLDAASSWAWRRWRATVTVDSGAAEVVARAWDSAAATQPEDPAQLWNPKGYANNSWARLRLRVR